MREEWRIFWRGFLPYRRYPLWGLALSLLPYWFNYSYWKARDARWLGLLLTFNVSLMVTLMIFVFIGGGFAIVTVMHLRTGLQIKREVLLQFILVGLGIASGILLGRYINSLVLREPLEMSGLLPTLILSGLAGVGFALHKAYRQAKEDKLALQAAVAESKYHALEHQMRPHFLFNALNSLAELIESGHERAAEMTHQLADLYRLILANSKLKTAPLDAELEIARRYLELESLRFGARLRYSIASVAGAERLYLPSLMTQTLVENAVKHGIAKSVAGGWVKVEVRQLSPKLYQLRVENSGEPFIEEPTRGTGLANTRERLDLLYGSRHQFSINTVEDGTTVASFCFTGERLD